MVSGCSVELERTMVVGEPTGEQEKYFKLMLEAREKALDTIKPGVRCSEVGRAVRMFFKGKTRKILETPRRTGIGLEYHEPPFLDIGDDTELKPGMTIIVEPGIYVEKLGAFRHSDTILVAEDGYEKLTIYPEELEELVVM